MGRLFDICGPFRLERTGRQWDVKRARKEIEHKYDGLGYAVGCYAFLLPHGSAVKPWYIGMTICNGGLSYEAFTPDKLKKYTGLFNEYAPSNIKHGQILFFPLLTSSGRYSRAKHKRMIHWLELQLMGLAFSSNPDIINVQGMKFHKEVSVFGLIGEPQRAAHQYEEVLYARKAFLAV